MKAHAEAILAGWLLISRSYHIFRETHHARSVRRNLASFQPASPGAGIRIHAAHSCAYTV